MIKVKGSFQGKPTSVLFNDGMLFAPDLFQAALDDLMTESEVVLSSAAPIVPDYSDEPSMAMLIESLFDSIDSTTSGLGAWWVDVAPSPIDLSKHAQHDQSTHGNWARRIAGSIPDAPALTMEERLAVRTGSGGSPELRAKARAYFNMKARKDLESRTVTRTWQRDNEILLETEGRAFRWDGTTLTARNLSGNTPEQRAREIQSIGYEEINKHYGPGPHPGTGTDQSIHGKWGEDWPHARPMPRVFTGERFVPVDDAISGRPYTESEKNAMRLWQSISSWQELRHGAKLGLFDDSMVGVNRTYVSELLRTPMADRDQAWQDRLRAAMLRNTARDLDTAIAAKVTTQPIVLFRGRGFDGPEATLQVGDTWENPNYIAATGDEQSGKEYAFDRQEAHETNNALLMEIRVPAGYHVGVPHRHPLPKPNDAFEEFILPRHSKFRVTEVKEIRYGADPSGIGWQGDPITRITVDLIDQFQVRKHYGPGPHPGTGTPQDVHGHGAPFLPVGTGETVNRDVILDANGNPAPLGMEHLPPEVQADVLKTVGLYGQTFEGLRANIDTVFESAATRYEQMNSDRAWHPEDEYPEWLRDREYDGFREQLTEQGKDGRWRWVEDAGSHLRDLDRFYASHHEDLFDLAEIHDEPFGEVVAHHAAVSPGLRANENMRMTELAVQYWTEDFKFSPEQAEYINGHIQTDREKILGKGGWRAERIAPQLEFEVEAGMSYREVMKAAQPEAMARIMYRTQLFEGESLSLGRGYSQHAKGLNILYNDLDIDQHLTGPKVRSFYNNIIDPYAERDDITVDFQTTDAAWGGRGSNETVETDFTTTPRYKGVGLGVRPAVATAVRQSGASFSDRIEFENAAEMQEVLWAEWKRGTPTGGRGRSKRYGEGKWGIEWIEKVS